MLLNTSMDIPPSSTTRYANLSQAGSMIGWPLCQPLEALSPGSASWCAELWSSLVKSQAMLQVLLGISTKRNDRKIAVVFSRVTTKSKWLWYQVCICEFIVHQARIAGRKPISRASSTPAQRLTAKLKKKKTRSWFGWRNWGQDHFAPASRGVLGNLGRNSGCCLDSMIQLLVHDQNQDWSTSCKWRTIPNSPTVSWFFVTSTTTTRIPRSRSLAAAANSSLRGICD